MSDTTALRTRLEKTADKLDYVGLKMQASVVREAIAAFAPAVPDGGYNGPPIPSKPLADRTAAAPAPDVVFTCARCGEKGNPPRCDHFAQAWTQEEIAAAHSKLTAAAPAPEGLDEWALRRVEDMASNARINAGRYGVKLLKGHGYPNEVMSDAQDALALETVLAALRVRPALSDDRGYLRVQGRCPSCGSDSLFLGSKGYVTCSVLGCKDPGAATDVLRPALSDETLRRLVDKWEGEAIHYEARTDDDYRAHAMMLRYCAVQLDSAVRALRARPALSDEEIASRPGSKPPAEGDSLQAATRSEGAAGNPLSDETLRAMADEWAATADNWRHNRGQRGRAKAGYEVLEACADALRAFLARQQEQTK